MINLTAFLILTLALFIMMISLSRRGPLQNQKTFLVLALAGWIAAAGVFVIQESVHEKIIIGESKTKLPSQIIPIPLPQNKN